jgi:hypothetical protein
MFLKFDKNADNLLPALGISEERFHELINKRNELSDKTETFFDVIDSLNNDDSLTVEEFTFLMIQLGVMRGVNSVMTDGISDDEDIEAGKEYE